MCCEIFHLARALGACAFSHVLQLHVFKTCCRALPLHASSIRVGFPCTRAQRATHFSYLVEHFTVLPRQRAELAQNPRTIRVLAEFQIFHLARAGCVSCRMCCSCMRPRHAAGHCPCMLAASEMDCQELPCARAQRATPFKRCLRSKTGCRALPLHASMLAASEMHCQELPCARAQRVRRFSHLAKHYIKCWSGSWQNPEPGENCQIFHLARAHGACFFSHVLQLHVSKTGCRALPLHASMLAASELDCQELPCARAQLAAHFSYLEEQFFESWPGSWQSCQICQLGAARTNYAAY